MPRIKLYQGQLGVSGAGSRGTPQSRVQFSPEDFDSSSIGQAVTQGVKQYAAVQQKQKIIQDAKDSSWANQSLATYEKGVIKDIEELRNKADPLKDGAETHVADVDALTKTKMKALIDIAPDSVKENLRSRLMANNNRYFGRALEFQSKATGVKIADEYDKTTSDIANTAFKHPEYYETQRQQISQVTSDIIKNNPKYNVADLANLEQDALQKVDFAASKGMINNAETPEAIDEIIKEMSTEGSIFNTRLSPANFQTLSKYADTTKTQIINKQETEASDNLKEFAATQAVEVAVMLGQLERGDISPAEVEIMRDSIIKDKRNYTGKAGSIISLDSALRKNTKKSINLSPYEKKLQTYKHGMDVHSIANYAYNGREDGTFFSKEDLALFEELGRFETVAEYKKVEDAIIKREEFEKATQRKDEKTLQKLDKWWTKSKKENNKLKKSYEVTDTIRSIAGGMYSEKEVTGMATYFGPRYKEALKALDSWNKQDEKVKEKHFNHLRSLSYIDFSISTRNVSTTEGVNGYLSEARRRVNLPFNNKNHMTASEYKTIEGRLDQQLVKNRAIALLQEEFARSSFDKANVLRKLTPAELNHFDEFYQATARAISNEAAERAFQDPSNKFRIMSEARDDMVRIIVNTGVVPKSVNQGITAGLRSSDSDTVLQSADMMRRITTARPQDADMFNDKEFAIGNMMLQLIDDGVGPKEAHERTMDSINASSQSRNADRNKEFTKVNSEKKGKITVGIDALKDLIDNDDTWDLDAALPPEFTNGFMRTAKKYYEITGDMEASRKAAYTQMKGTWGVSYMTGKPKFVLRPPELMYAVAGMSAEENSNWMREQAAHNLSENGIVDQDIIDRVIFTPHPTQTFEGKPTYTVIILNEGGTIHSQQGSWYPDYDSSPQKKRYILRTEALETEEEERQQKIEEVTQLKKQAFKQNSQNITNWANRNAVP
tara:strand:+ start:589 stop:3435 length:2847 start_codon:yes stop_codon:yes gene_type:complete